MPRTPPSARGAAAAVAALLVAGALGSRRPGLGELGPSPAEPPQDHPLSESLAELARDGAAVPELGSRTRSASSDYGDGERGSLGSASEDASDGSSSSVSGSVAPVERLRIRELRRRVRRIEFLADQLQDSVGAREAKLRRRFLRRQGVQPYAQEVARLTAFARSWEREFLEPLELGLGGPLREAPIKARLEALEASLGFRRLPAPPGRTPLGVRVRAEFLKNFVLRTLDADVVEAYLAHMVAAPEPWVTELTFMVVQSALARPSSEQEELARVRAAERAFLARPPTVGDAPAPRVDDLHAAVLGAAPRGARGASAAHRLGLLGVLAALDAARLAAAERGAPPGASVEARVAALERRLRAAAERRQGMRVLGEGDDAKWLHDPAPGSAAFEWRGGTWEFEAEPDEASPAPACLQGRLLAVEEDIVGPAVRWEAPGFLMTAEAVASNLRGVYPLERQVAALESWLGDRRQSRHARLEEAAQRTRRGLALRLPPWAQKARDAARSRRARRQMS